MIKKTSVKRAVEVLEDALEEAKVERRDFKVSFIEKRDPLDKKRVEDLDEVINDIEYSLDFLKE